MSFFTTKTSFIEGPSTNRHFPFLPPYDGKLVHRTSFSLCRLGRFRRRKGEDGGSRTRTWRERLRWLCRWKKRTASQRFDLIIELYTKSLCLLSSYKDPTTLLFPLTDTTSVENQRVVEKGEASPSCSSTLSSRCGSFPLSLRWYPRLDSRPSSSLVTTKICHPLLLFHSILRLFQSSLLRLYSGRAFHQRYWIRCPTGWRFKGSEDILCSFYSTLWAFTLFHPTLPTVRCDSRPTCGPEYKHRRRNRVIPPEEVVLLWYSQSSSPSPLNWLSPKPHEFPSPPAHGLSSLQSS